QEIATHGGEREIEEPRSGRARQRKKTEQQQPAASSPERALDREEAIGGVEPAESGQVPEADRAIVRFDSRQEIACRQDSLRAGEPRELTPQRDERDHRDEPQR